jgi:cobalt/nickel transport system permease protein
MFSVDSHLAPSSHAYLNGVDPRARIFVAVAFSVWTTVLQHFSAMSATVAVSIFAGVFSGFSLAAVVKRLLPINAVFLGLFLLLPFTAPGSPTIAIGPLHPSAEGLLLASAIAMKGNAIVLMAIALLGTMDPAVMGHALNHLRVPQKLALLLLFTVRYVEVLHREYARLRAAMRVRAFRPGMNRHTYRAFGYLVGMLLVRSLDRSERILAAMKCRGFDGRFYLLDHFAFTKNDLPFAVASILAASILIWMELCLKH